MNSQHFAHSAFLSQNSTLFSDLVMQSAWFSDKTEETLKVSCVFLTKRIIAFPCLQTCFPTSTLHFYLDVFMTSHWLESLESLNFRLRLTPVQVLLELTSPQLLMLHQGQVEI